MDRRHRVVVVDDQAIVRQGFCAIIESQPDFEVVGQAGDGVAAVRCVTRHKPDLVVMDLLMPRMNGADAIRTIKRVSPATRVVALTARSDEDFLAEALEAGADGYVVKDASFEEFVLAARSVLAGYRYISPQAAGPVVERYLADRAGRAPGPSEVLTPREKQVLKLVAEGHSRRQIAELLCLSVKTVEKDGTSLRKKLGAKNVAQLTAYALEKGLARL